MNAARRLNKADPTCIAYVEAIRNKRENDAIKVINAGFPPNAEIDGVYGNALEFACREGMDQVAEALLARGATLRHSFKLHDVVKHPFVVNLLLKEKLVDPNAVKNTYNCEPPLADAIDGNHVATVRVLLMHGANPNQLFHRDTQLLSPLAFAKAKAHRSIIALLKNAQDIKRETGISEFDRIRNDQYPGTFD